MEENFIAHNFLFTDALKVKFCRLLVYQPILEPLLMFMMHEINIPK